MVRNALFLLAVFPAVLAAARRLARREGRLAFDALVAELRAAGRSRPLPPGLAHPERLAGAVERLLPWLPPRGYGRCLKRALLLLELWSRCGLEVRLHLGFRPGSGGSEAHAWVTATGPGGAVHRASSGLDYGEAFVFAPPGGEARGESA
ncbi:MAG TPA: lasso peptide biosynthesis B2 protein [Thermoanaerobaculia bacterium]|nr:lasso peptide biosynthesis B2 protein [Thermoanaerobaculia bacterium]